MSWEDLDCLLQVNKEFVNLEEKAMTQVLVVWKSQRDADTLPERMKVFLPIVYNLTKEAKKDTGGIH